MRTEMTYRCSYCSLVFDEEERCANHEYDEHLCPLENCEATFRDTFKPNKELGYTVATELAREKRQKHIEEKHPELRRRGAP